MKLKEIWKSVPGYEGLYQVSDLGRMYSVKNNLLLKPIRRGDYLAINLYKNNKSKTYNIHRIVASVFIGPIAKGMVVNHINENKYDNRAINLEIITPEENNSYGTINQRRSRTLSRPLVLIPYERPDDKLYFRSSLEAGDYFKYKHARQVSCNISAARKAGRNYINIKGEKYVFEIVG